MFGRVPHHHHCVASGAPHQLRYVADVGDADSMRLRFTLSVAKPWAMRCNRKTASLLKNPFRVVAIKVFGDNVRDMMLAAPACNKVAMGLDPGIRTGVKVAVADATGKVVATSVVYPHDPRKD